jgi:hypothetical protein
MAAALVLAAFLGAAAGLLWQRASQPEVEEQVITGNIAARQTAGQMAQPPA